jgi:hypothetical protein
VHVFGVAACDHALWLLSVSRTLLQCHMFSDIVPGLLRPRPNLKRSVPCLLPLCLQGAMDIVASSLGTSLRHAPSSNNAVSAQDPQHEDLASGHVSTITDDSDVVYVVQAKGAPRRCGGLGDILSGTTATALHWALQVKCGCFCTVLWCVPLVRRLVPMFECVAFPSS